MKISELPKKYRELAEMRRAEYETLIRFPAPNANTLGWTFIWHETPEGDEFWRDCHFAKTVDDLPPIPETKSTGGQNV